MYNFAKTSAYIEQIDAPQFSAKVNNLPEQLPGQISGQLPGQISEQLQGQSNIQVITTEQGSNLIDLDDVSYDQLIASKFELSGNDLVITTDSESFLVADYLLSKSDISSSGDAVLEYEMVTSLIRTDEEYSAIEQVTSTSVGQISSLTGKAYSTNLSGQKVLLKPGSIISSGDIINTSSKSSIEISFKDGSSINLGSSAQIVVDNFLFEETSGVGSVVMSVFKGIFAFASGLVARDEPANVKIKTPIAEIGLRGTKFAGDIDPDGESIVTLIDGRAVIINDEGVYELSRTWQSVGGSKDDLQPFQTSSTRFLTAFKEIFPDSASFSRFASKSYTSAVPKVFLENNPSLQFLVEQAETEEQSPSTSGQYTNQQITFDGDLFEEELGISLDGPDIQTNIANVFDLFTSRENHGKISEAILNDPWLGSIFSEDKSIGYENIFLSENFYYEPAHGSKFGLAPEDYKLLPEFAPKSAISKFFPTDLINNALNIIENNAYHILLKLEYVDNPMLAPDYYFGSKAKQGLEFHLRTNDFAEGSTTYSDIYNVHLVIDSNDFSTLENGGRSSSANYGLFKANITETKFQIQDRGSNNKLVLNLYTKNSGDTQVLDLSQEMTLFKNIDVDTFKSVTINIKIIGGSVDDLDDVKFILKLSESGDSSSDNFVNKWLAKMDLIKRFLE